MATDERQTGTGKSALRPMPIAAAALRHDYVAKQAKMARPVTETLYEHRRLLSERQTLLGSAHRTCCYDAIDRHGLATGSQGLSCCAAFATARRRFQTKKRAAEATRLIE